MKMRWVGPAFVALVGIGATTVRGGAPAPSDVVAGLLSPSAEVRTATATRLASADLVAAAPAIPALVEALDDEVPAVAEAAQGAIVALANQAAPLVFQDLDAEVGSDGLPGVLVALGDALIASDIAAGLSAANDGERRVLFVALAIRPRSRRSGPEELRARLRMATVEAERARGDDRRSASAAAALLGHRVAWERARRLGATFPELSAPALAPRLVKAIMAIDAANRACFAKEFVAATGIGDAAVAAALAFVPRVRVLRRMVPDVMSEVSARALARLSLAEPTARAGLERLSPEAFRWLAGAVASAGGERLVAERAGLARPDDALAFARIAAEAGDRSPALLAIYAASLDAGAPDERISDAAFGVAAMGEAAVGARPALETLLPRLADRAGPRIAVASALLAISPGHESATAALIEEVEAPIPRAEDMRWSRSTAVGHRSRATQALSAGGSGPIVYEALVKLLAPVSRRENELPAELARVRAAAAGVARLAGDRAFDAGFDLAALLVPHAGDDESATAYHEIGVAAALPYEIRSIALRSLGALGAGAKPFADRVRGFLTASDPRLRYLAAQALRRIGG